MAETWLRPNRKPLAVGSIPPLLAAIAGGVLASGLVASTWWIRAPGLLLLAAALVVLLSLLRQAVAPRLAYRDGYLLVNLRAGRPLEVPLDVVEGFLLGQGPAGLSGQARQAESANFVIRLADSADEWSQVDVDRTLGSWCDGYVTIRGTWCEPLSLDVAHRLNQRLGEVKQQARQSEVAG